MSAAAPVTPLTEHVRRAARGDAAAFETLVEAAGPRAFRTARAILGNDADARDVIQEAFVAAWRELPRLRDPERFEGWLRRIVVNGCRAQYRSRRHIREISLEPGLEAPASGPTLPDAVGDAELLGRAFDRLPAEKRSLLVLHYLDREPIGAIAATLGIPGGTVKWRLSEARAALARALTAEGEAR